MTKPITDEELRARLAEMGVADSGEYGSMSDGDVDAVIMFIKSYAKDYAEQREANVRHDIAALAPPCEHGLDDKDHNPYCGFINNIWQNWASKNGMTWKPDEIRAEQRERMQ